MPLQQLHHLPVRTERDAHEVGRHVGGASVLVLQNNDKIRWVGAKVFLHIAGEIRRRREIEPVADFGEREAPVAEQTADFQCGIARNPVVGREATHLLRHFGEVFRRDAELVGIIGDLAVLEKRAAFQKGEEAVHDVVVLCGDISFLAILTVNFSSLCCSC